MALPKSLQKKTLNSAWKIQMQLKEYCHPIVLVIIEGEKGKKKIQKGTSKQIFIKK